MSEPTKVDVLGMGPMGRAVAERIRGQGHHVVVWNRTPGKGGGLPEVPSAAEAVDAAQVIVVVVQDGAAVQEVCSDLLLEAFPPDACLFIASTVAPEVVRGLDAKLPGRVVDTAVIGSPDMVREGQATLLVGGGAKATPAANQLLDDLTDNHIHCGSAGTGTTMKIVSNVQLVVGVAALAEAVATARSQGVTDDVLTAVFGESIMVSFGARMGLRAMLEPDRQGLLGPASNAISDVKLCLALADDINLVLTPAVLNLLGRVPNKDETDLSALIDEIEPKHTRPDPNTTVSECSN